MDAAKLSAAAGAALVMASATLAFGGAASASFPNANGFIVYSSTRANTAGDTTGDNLWLVNPVAVAAEGTPTATNDPTQTHELTSTQSDDQGGFFSPDGTTVVFFSDRGAGNEQIWTVPANNVPTAEDSTGTSPGVDGATQLISDSSEDTWPSFSPDGHTIAYISGGTSTVGSQIDLFDTANPGAAPVALISGAGNIAENRPVFDPVDPTKLVYTTAAGHLILVSNLNTPAQTSTDLSVGAGIGADQADEYPDWSPDGTTLIFDSNRVVGTSGGAKQLFTLNVAAAAAGTATAVPVFQSNGSGIYSGHSDYEPVFSPDGKQIAFTRSFGGNDVDDEMLNTQGGVHGSTAGVVDLTLAPSKPSDTEPDWQGVAAPASALPESPAVIALPGAALLVVGGILFLRRRQPATP